jgi:hypothetical protein
MDIPKVNNYNFGLFVKASGIIPPETAQPPTKNEEEKPFESKSLPTFKSPDNRLLNKRPKSTSARPIVSPGTPPSPVKLQKVNKPIRRTSDPLKLEGKVFESMISCRNR